MIMHTEPEIVSDQSICLRYFDDGKELVVQIHEKQKELPEDVGEDFSKAESFHRMHAAFERDITALGKQVQCSGSAFFLVSECSKQRPRGRL